ncbi:Iron-binding zinc finger protein, CDGSH type [Aphelenchoides fujianensis]|nr:Iron-binding zinc finger protein, CDGSH type [Aphelenchoides fujianensis]
MFGRLSSPSTAAVNRVQSIRSLGIKNVVIKNPPTPSVGHKAASGPARLDLEAGRTYFYCSCGHSSKQPFCDGSHKEEGRSLRPIRFEVDTSGRYSLCQCKHSKFPPLCDGSHKLLNRESLDADGAARLTVEDRPPKKQ